MKQHTPAPRKTAPQRIISTGRQGKSRWIGWRGVPLLLILIWVFLYLPTQGSSLQRARLAYVFLVLGFLVLALNLLMVAKRRSVVPVVTSFFGSGAALGLMEGWLARAGFILCVVALDAGVLLWARSRHP